MSDSRFAKRGLQEKLFAHLLHEEEVTQHEENSGHRPGDRIR
jgi:hypothetical protein